MDNTQIEKIVALIPVLKYKFMGCYPSNLLPNDIPENSFYIVNTDVSNGRGIHWILLARKNSCYYYGDSLGRDINHYANIKFTRKTRKLIATKLQTDSICALYSIYFAYVLFNNLSLFNVDDAFIMRFFAEYL